MMKQTITTIKALNLCNLLTIAGLAVSNDKVELTVIPGNPKKAMANKSISIDPPFLKNSTCIHALHKTNEGLIVKMETDAITTSVYNTIGILANMMEKQNLTSVYFPAISNGTCGNFYVGVNSINLVKVEGITDMQVYGEKVFFNLEKFPRQLRLTTVVDMFFNSNWKKISDVEYSFPEAIRGLGRINKNGSLPVTLVNNKIITYNTVTKNRICAEEVAHNNTISLGKFKLCDKLDHAMQMFVGNSNMCFIPAN
ncbi:MAG: hypothetical protein WCG01_03520 [bacterium]